MVCTAGGDFVGRHFGGRPQVTGVGVLATTVGCAGGVRLDGAPSLGSVKKSSSALAMQWTQGCITGASYVPLYTCHAKDTEVRCKGLYEFLSALAIRGTQECIVGVT